MELAGRTVLLTGAAGGLGEHIARSLVAAGADLVLTDLPGAALDARSTAFGARSVPADLTLPDQVERLAHEAGAVDVVVHNAGIEGAGRFEELSPALLEAVVRVNLLAPVLLTRALLPGMRARGRGHVVTVSSTAGKLAMAYLAPYSATKAGAATLMRALRAEAEDDVVGFSTVFPGAVGAGMGVKAVELARRAHLPASLVSRRPELVGEAVVTAVRTGRAELVVSAPPVRAVAVLHALAPRAAIGFMGGVPKRLTAQVLRDAGDL